MINKTLTIVLAGGVGSRLKPLTTHRAKPAVPFGGKYRVIDFTLSNCLHSGLRRILVLTQYKSHSLQMHLRDGWSIFNPELREYVTPVPPQMRTGESWYAGTADAIYQNLYLLERSEAEWVLVLAGDHIYRMDYAAMLQAHRDTRADVSVASMLVPLADASAFGVLEVDKNNRIEAFHEKPEQPKPAPGYTDRTLGSMGIYVFSLPQLCQLLREDHERENSQHDFGRNILPGMLSTHRVMAYQFGGKEGRVSQDGYWCDVGTIDAFYKANMDLLSPNPPLDLYQQQWAIRTYNRQNPPARAVPGPNGHVGEVTNSILADGSVVAGGTVRNSILFPNSRVEEGAVVEDSLLFDGVVVHKGARVRKCIIDKNSCVPANSQIGINPAVDAKEFSVSPEGVVVIPKGHRCGTTTAN